MNNIFDQINAIPGIIGIFFFDSVKGVKAGHLPPVFKKQNLNKIGNVLDKMYEMSRSGVKTVSDLSLYYDESTLIMRKIDKTCSIIIICDPSLNQNLLFMTLNMLENDLRTFSSRFDASDEDPETVQEAALLPPTNVSEDEVIKNSPVSRQLQGMQAALPKILGPMASIIFKEAVQEWIQTQEPCEDAIPVLLDTLANEINDDEKQAKYMDLIAPCLNADRIEKD